MAGDSQRTAGTTRLVALGVLGLVLLSGCGADATYMTASR